MPALAERTGITPYHPSHIAERYGLFTVIVLGESVTAVVRTLEAAVHEAEHKAGLIGLAAAGLLILSRCGGSTWTDRRSGCWKR